MTLFLLACAMAAVVPVEVVGPPGTCGAFISQSNITETGGLAPTSGQGNCNDGSPWFWNHNYEYTRTVTVKIYVGGVRYLCYPWAPNGLCNNSSPLPPCTPSTCGL